MTLPGSGRRLVLDASAGIKLVLEEEHSEKVTTLVGDILSDPTGVLMVPDLFFLECANILWKRVRRSELLPDVAEAHLQRLISFGFEVTPGSALVLEALQLGIQRDVTAYDASYVVLARRAKTQLVTDDRRLSEKFPQEVVWLPHWPR